MKRRILSVFSLLVLLLTSFLLVRVGLSVVQSSPLIQFNVTTGNSPEGIRLNWTNNYATNISVIAANTTWNNLITVNVSNETAVSLNYSQPYDASDPSACSSGSFYLLVKNESFGYNRTIGPLNSSNVTNVTLFFNYASLSICRSGRYYVNNYTIMNSSRVNESANISVTIDIPISSNNTINSNLPTTGTGYFGGTLPKNGTMNHSYYFNTSELTNAMSVAINLSGWSTSQDLDVFLFDNSSTPLLKAKSINKTSATESLLYSFLNYLVPAMWEIRIYGNSTSTILYRGNIFFSTLNATNSNNTAQQVSSINFTTMNVTSNSTYNLTLENEGNISLTSVAETKELYYIKKYAGTANQSFLVFVPDSSIATKIKISLNWTGASNYSFNLYDSTGTLRASSINKYGYANKTGAMQEEYNETTSISSSVGTWNITVTNNTNVTWDPYNVTVYIYVNPSSWITTNYSTYTFINGTYNNSRDVQINLTVPNDALDGNYEGCIQYLDNRNAGLRIPIYINVTTPFLIVNNTLNTGLLKIDENYGANLTRTINVTLNNTGTYNLILNITNSSNLICNPAYTTSCTGSWVNFSITPSNTVPKGGWQIINGTITFNSSAPVGVYDGWIFFNGTNSTSALSSRPYQTFNLTVRLNLTNILNVYIDRLKSFDGLDGEIGNINVTQNLTHKINITYINGTPIKSPYDDPTSLTTSNFSINFTEGNISYNIPTAGSLSLYNGTNPIYCTSGCLGDSTNFYYVNASVPANKTGGRYAVRVSVNYTKNYSSNSFTYFGTGINRTLVINNTGLYMTTPNSTSISMTNGSTSMFAVNVSNYGKQDASSATIEFSRGSCTAYSVAITDHTDACSATHTGATFTISPPAYNTSCMVWWTISAGSSNASACTANIIGSPSNVWFNPYGVNATISVSISTGTTSSSAASSSAQTTTTTTAYTSNLTFISPPTVVYVLQNSTNTTTVTVKNTGRRNQNVTFSIDTLSSSVWSITTTSQYIAVGESATFTIKFNSTNLDSIDYLGKFKATSSDVTVTSDFKLRVLPSQAKQQEINLTYEQYKLNLTELSKQINQTKSQGVNVSVAESDYLLLKAKMDQVDQYMRQGNYFDAYQSFGEIKSLFDKIRNELTTAKESKGGILGLGNMFGLKNPYIIFGIIGALIGGAVLAYLFWPTKTPTAGFKTETVKPQPKKPEESFLFKSKEGAEDIWNKLKEKWSGLRGSKEKKVEYKGS